MPEDPSNSQKLTDGKKYEENLVALLESLSLGIGKAELPPKKPPGTFGFKKAVKTNTYQINNDNAGVLFRYDVSVTGVSLRGHEVDFTKRSDSSIVIAERNNICRDVFNLIVDKFRDVFGNDRNSIFYDLQSILYTVNTLPIEPTASIRLTLNKGDPNVEMPGNFESVTCEIKNVRESAQQIDLKDLSPIINENTLARDRSVLNFIELAANQYPLMNKHEFLTLGGPTAFFMNGAQHGLPEMELDRGGTKYLASGARKSAMLIEGHKKADSDPNQRRAGLVLEAVHSPFHSVMSLLEYIQRHSKTNLLYHEFIRGKLNQHGLMPLNSIIKNVQLEVRYPNGKTRKIQPKSFDESTANNHMIQDLQQSVAQYFEQKYGRLTNPDAHLVKAKQGSSTCYFPPELLHIPDNQIVTAEQMDASSKATMIRNCAIRPDIKVDQNRKAAAAIRLHESEHTATTGIKFSKEPLSTEARVLQPPAISYSDKLPETVSTKEAAWRMSRFVEPSQLATFAVYLITEEGRSTLSSEEIKKFIEEIKNSSKRTGMQIGECVDSGEYSDSQVEICVQYCSENDIRLCLFITPKNIKNCHNVMKMCEHRYNVITQDIQVGTVSKIISGCASATLDNYIAKTNIKLGGLNHKIKASNEAIQKELEETMFLSIATNQSGSKSRVERITTARSDEKPGVLGYSANIDSDYNKFLGDFFYIPAFRHEFSSEMREIIRICVQRFKHNRGKPPKSIVFYYTGLSEGEFGNVYKYAIPLIRDGIRNGNNGSNIPLTILAVQKINNVRIFPMQYPANGKDFEFNVPHGTIVDTTIVSPVFSEFYLMAHSALKGTGRVPRYTVLVDDNDFSIDILQGVTHVLSYEHQIVARATRMPTPVNVAEDYARRGRDVFNAEYKLHGNDLPRDSSGALDLQQMSEAMNYSNTELKGFRVNA